MSDSAEAVRAATSSNELGARVVTLPREASLSDRAVEQLERLIVTGTFARGQRLPSERELAAQFGVSRTVIREAVRTLAANGLVEVTNGSGTVARSVSPQSAARSVQLMLQTHFGGIDLEKVVEVRRVLEDHIAVAATERRTPEDLVALQAALDRAAASGDDPEAFVAADLEFHAALARATQNELFPLLLDSLGLVMVEVRRIGARLQDTPSRALVHHRAVLDAVRAGDGLAARAAMDAHMDEARDTVLRAATLRSDL